MKRPVVAILRNGRKVYGTPEIKEGFWWVRETPKKKMRLALIKRYGTPILTIQFFNHVWSGFGSESTELSDYPKIQFIQFIPRPK